MPSLTCTWASGNILTSSYWYQAALRTPVVLESSEYPSATMHGSAGLEARPNVFRDECTLHGLTHVERLREVATLRVFFSAHTAVVLFTHRMKDEPRASATLPHPKILRVYSCSTCVAG